MRARITDGIVTSTTLLLITVLLTIMIAGCGMTTAPGPGNTLQTVTAGISSYADKLNNSNNPGTQAAQWDGMNGNDFQCVFGSDGNYHVIQLALPVGNVNLVPFSLHACHEDSYQYENATIVVNVTIHTGHSGGLFLRYQKDSFGNYTGYLFEIDNNSNYKFSIFTGNVLSPLNVLQDWKLSSALKAGFNVMNTLEVIMTGNKFALYANDSYITTLTDSSSAYGSGDVAFFASSARVTTEVLFSNLKVYQMS